MKNIKQTNIRRRMPQETRNDKRVAMREEIILLWMVDKTQKLVLKKSTATKRHINEQRRSMKVNANKLSTSLKKTEAKVQQQQLNRT